MDLAFALALRVGLLVYSVVVPGAAVLRAVRFSSTSALDRVLACLAVGAACTSLTVTTLLLVGLYFRPVVAILLLIPVVYLSRTGTLNRDSPRGHSRLTVPALSVPTLSNIDRAVVVAAVCFLVVYLLDAWTSPITWWDGLASWGKWAADWGRRTSSANYVVGAYPQLVPRIVSIMYKLTGAHSDVLPLDFFALHGVYVLFAVWFLLAAIRLTQVLEVPAWPVILAGLGSMQFREHAAAGTVDVLLSALVLTLLALYLGFRRGSWTAASPTPILGAAAFAVLFTKWPGAIGLLIFFLVDRAARKVYPVQPDRDVALARSVRLALGIAALGMLPFLIEQGISEARINHWRSDPFEVDISARQMPTLLSTDANVVYRGGDAKVRAGLVQLRFWNSYDIPGSLRTLFTLFLIACLAASATWWFTRAALPPMLVYIAIWLYWSSYDQRNIFNIIPLLALCASAGAARLWRLPPKIVWANAVTVLVGLFLVLSGGSILKELQARVASMTTGPRAMPLRLQAMRGTPAEKVARFYPSLNDDYQFISALSQRTHATHVLVTTPLFRFFDRGAHAMARFPYEQVQPGDVFASHEWLTPPADDRWVLVHKGSTHRVWVRVSELGPIGPPETHAGDGRVLYDVERGDLSDEGLVVWRATLPTDSAKATAVFQNTATLTLNDGLTSSACETAARPAGQLRCGGIVALRPEAARAYQAGQLEVGITTDAPADVTLAIGRLPAAPAARQ